MSGYTRQSAADIIPTATVRAAPINNELNAIRDTFAFDGTGVTGHKHDGSSDEGSYVPLIADIDGNNKVVVDSTNNRVGVFTEVSSAPVEQVRIQDGVIVPVADNDIDLGTSSVEFKNLYLDGTAKIDTLTVDENATVAGTLGVTGLSTLASADINAGTIDGTVIGAASAQAITGTLITASTGFSGTLTGNVTGNLTGNSAGTHTGPVIGNVTGNVTSTGTSSFANVTIDGSLNMNSGTSATVTGLSTPVDPSDAATKNYVDTSISNLIDSAPSTLDTLNELAAALGDDPNFATTITNSIATKLPLAGGTMSGAIAMGTNKVTGLGNPTSAQDAATKTYVDTADALKLNLTGGTMTGNIVMGANKVTSTATPTTDDDLTRKAYVDSILGSATAAATSAAAALVSETNASTSETNAATSETNAASSASAASTSASNAASSASAASTSASNASASASAAATSESNTAASEAAAATSETNAATSESNASASASAAATSESNAAASESAAATSASNASTSETNAATSETNAAASASAASTSASNAASSASAASTSASNAATSETNAATSETNAASSETAAATSASNAATSESNASASASAAATSESNAAASASAAATSASNASTSETNAATSEANAAASYDAFDDRYLGSKASAPTLDNDGNALLTGALYWNTSSEALFIWTGSVWSAAAFDTSGALVAINNLSDVQDAATARANLGISDITVLNNKTSAYTVVSGDLGKTIYVTGDGTFAISLTSAATLGSGFNVKIWNTGDGTITINPAGAEYIDSATGSPQVLYAYEGIELVSNGTNWYRGTRRASLYYAENANDAAHNPPVASGTYSLALGAGATSSGNVSIALGGNVTASGASSTAIGRTGGNAGAVAAGSGAISLSSYASGTDSFAAAIGNNTSTYGATGSYSVAIGKSSKASGGLDSVAIGTTNISSGFASWVFGSDSTASGNYSLALGYNNVATGTGSMAIGSNASVSEIYATVIGGNSNTASGGYAIVTGGRSNISSSTYSRTGGYYATSGDITGKDVWASGRLSAEGDAQTGTLVLRRATSDATASVLTSTNSSASTINQVILPNNSAYAFHGTIVARQDAASGTACAAWKIEGLIRREGSAGTTVLVNSATTVLDNTPAWGMALTADVTNGGLAVTVTGAAATNIRWVATINTSEVTY